MPTENRIFFSNEQAYTAWIQSIPGIFHVQEDGPDELAETEGPYFFSPQCLILRFQRDYCALLRVETRQQADFTWYVARSRDEGEEVFAAYLWNRGDDSPKIVGGSTIEQVRAALTEFLHDDGNRLATVRLWPV